MMRMAVSIGIAKFTPDDIPLPALIMVQNYILFEFYFILMVVIIFEKLHMALKVYNKLSFYLYE